MNVLRTLLLCCSLIKTAFPHYMYSNLNHLVNNHLHCTKYPLHTRIHHVQIHLLPKSLKGKRFSQQQHYEVEKRDVIKNKLPKNVYRSL